VGAESGACKTNLRIRTRSSVAVLLQAEGYDWPFAAWMRNGDDLKRNEIRLTARLFICVMLL
jgi:hypothetical protein